MKSLKSNLFFYTVPLILMLSMCGRKSLTERTISGSNYKLWERLNDEERQRKTKTYYYFNSEGKFQIYKSYNNSKSIVKLDMGDVVLIEKWSLKSEKEVDIAGYPYKILQLNDTCFSFIDTTKRAEITKLVYKNDVLP